MKMVKDGPQMGLKHGKNLIETKNTFYWKRRVKLLVYINKTKFFVEGCLSVPLMWENEKSFWHAVFCKWFVHQWSDTWKNKISLPAAGNGRNNSLFRPNWRKIDKNDQKRPGNGPKTGEIGGFRFKRMEKVTGHVFDNFFSKNTNSDLSKGLFRPKINRNMRFLD